MADHDFGDAAQAAVSGDSEIESARTEGVAEGVGVEGVGMNMLDGGRNFVEFVATRVEHRDSVAAMQKAVDDQMAGGAGAAYNESFHNGIVLWRGALALPRGSSFSGRRRSRK